MKGHEHIKTEGNSCLETQETVTSTSSIPIISAMRSIAIINTRRVLSKKIQSRPIFAKHLSCIGVKDPKCYPPRILPLSRKNNDWENQELVRKRFLSYIPNEEEKTLIENLEKEASTSDDFEKVSSDKDILGLLD